MEKIFIKVRSTKDITISATLTILGAVLLVLPDSTSINILGFFMLFAGLILLMTLKSGYKDPETGDRYCKVEKYFSLDMKQEIRSAIASAPDSINLKNENQGTGLRMDVYYNKTIGTAFVQLYEYIPYKYEPCTDIYQHSICKISKYIEK